MNFDITNFQTLAANLAVESEVRDLAHAEVSTQTEIDTQIGPLIQQVAATPIAEIDRVIAQFQEVKNHLQSEGERIERKMVRYTKLIQMASFTAKIIFDTISQRRPASTSEVTAASTENNMGAFEKSHHGQRDISDLGDEADASKKSASAAMLGSATPSPCGSDRGQPAPNEAC